MKAKEHFDIVLRRKQAKLLVLCRSGGLYSRWTNRYKIEFEKSAVDFTWKMGTESF